MDGGADRGGRKRSKKKSTKPQSLPSPTPRDDDPASTSPPKSNGEIALPNHTQRDRKHISHQQLNEEANGSVPTPKRRKNETAFAMAQATLPAWLNAVAIVGFIFGGCCANVFCLEAIVKEEPASGTLITFTQFLIVSLLTLPSHVSLSRGPKHFFLKPRAVPFKKWLIYTAFFITINLLNNKAFDYKISVPLHIILRSAGPVATMGVGYIYGKRYSKIQVLAVILLFAGVVQAAIADAQIKGRNLSLIQTQDTATSNTLIGFGILFLALMLSALMGVYTDRTYARYGRDHWSENLFYSHTLSLPIFLAWWPNLSTQFNTIMTSSPLISTRATTLQLPAILQNNPNLPIPFPKQIPALPLPIQPLYLLANALTQYLCIRGVNLLSAKSSSLTVTIVLNIRKLVSLLLSIYLFGNKPPPGVLTGAAIVFIGGALYAYPSTTAAKQSPKPRSKPPKRSKTTGQELNSNRAQEEVGGRKTEAEKKKEKAKRRKENRKMQEELSLANGTADTSGLQQRFPSREKQGAGMARRGSYARE